MPELGLFSNPYLFWAIAGSTLLQIGAVTLPLAQSIFEVEASLTWEWLLVVILSATPVTIIELIKIARSLSRRT